MSRMDTTDKRFALDTIPLERDLNMGPTHPGRLSLSAEPVLTDNGLTLDVLQIATGLDALRRRLQGLTTKEQYQEARAAYAAMRGIEIDVLSLTTFAGDVVDKLVKL